MRVVVCGALLVSSAVLVPSAPVQACEIPAACPDTYGTPADGKVIPANAPALFFRRGDGPDDGSNGAIDLVTGSGDPIPFSLMDDPANPPSGRLLVPSSPLPEGTIRFRTATCGPETGFFIDNTFTVKAASPLPTAMGTLSVGASAPVPVPNGLCDFMGLRRPVGVTWTFDPTPELEAFGALTQLTLKVDGAVWSKVKIRRRQHAGTDRRESGSRLRRMRASTGRCRPPRRRAGATPRRAVGSRRRHGG